MVTLTDMGEEPGLRFFSFPSVLDKRWKKLNIVLRRKIGSTSLHVLHFKFSFFRPI